jgi:hypothetical protein
LIQKQKFDSYLLFTEQIRYCIRKIILATFIIVRSNLFSSDVFFIEVDEKMVGEKIHKAHAEKKLERFPTLLSA